MMNEIGECPRCKLATEEELGDRGRETASLIDEIEEFLAGDSEEPQDDG